MAGTFWTSELPKVLRQSGVLYMLTSTSAARDNGLQFLISHLPRWLRTRRFSKPTFRPSGATKYWKNTVFRDFCTFSRTLILFCLTLSLPWLFPPLLVHLSILSEVWLWNFLPSSPQMTTHNDSSWILWRYIGFSGPNHATRNSWGNWRDFASHGHWRPGCVVATWKIQYTVELKWKAISYKFILWFVEHRRIDGRCPIYRWYWSEKWWFSAAMLNNQRALEWLWKKWKFKG